MSLLSSLVDLINNGKLPAQNISINSYLPTILNVHNAMEANNISRGRGIKVGILDRGFIHKNIDNIYARYINFSNDEYHDNTHGFAMASVLKEIAPEAEIYAINIDLFPENNRLITIYNALDWAINNKIDVLSHSGEILENRNNRDILNNISKKAFDHNIITTFIHCDSVYNFLPHGFYRINEGLLREPDFHILHYDYNDPFTFRIKNLINCLEKGMIPDSGNTMPFFSISSIAPTLAGFVAILKSVNKKLDIIKYKDILESTCKNYEFEGYLPFEKGSYDRVIDIFSAAKHMTELN